MTDDPARALISLFEEERRALLDGALDLIPAIGERKLALIAALAQADPGEEELARIAKGARRNGHLLAAALAGLAEGANRLEAIRSGARGFSAYDRTGRAERIDNAGQPGIERRA
ncbi:MAG: flagellar protein FlgN [Rubellimicrobium sp.]|nr:flagellar protein FlgN [Rubellimicrobium sp.]